MEKRNIPFNKFYKRFNILSLFLILISLILFILGSGPVKGFALTLGVGILTTLFSVYFIARLFTALYVIKNKDKEKLI